MMFTIKDNREVTEKSFDEVDLGEAIAAQDNGDVPIEYLGTATDMRDMITLGKKQLLRVSVSPKSISRRVAHTVKRNFRFITMLGFASTAMATWEILLP